MYHALIAAEQMADLFADIPETEQTNIVTRDLQQLSGPHPVLGRLFMFAADSGPLGSLYHLISEWPLEALDEMEQAA